MHTGAKNGSFLKKDCNRCGVAVLYRGVSAYRKRNDMNQDYFNRIYEKTYRRLLQYAIVHLSDPTDAEDALQNVYLDFYRRIERHGHFDVLLPQQFLLKMLKHEITRHYAEREQNRAYPIDAYTETLPDGADPFEDVVLNRAMANEVLALAKTLPAESYRIFVLYYGFEMRIPEIAETLGIGREAVKSRLFRARTALRNRLERVQRRKEA